MEEFKVELSKDAREHQVRFESLHARRVDAIEAVYVKLVDTRYTMEKFVTEWSVTNKEEGFQKVSQEFWELRRELVKRRIYFPEPLCDKLTECIGVMWVPAVAAKVWSGMTNAEHVQREVEAFEKAQKAISEDGAVAIEIANLEREFRNVLGGAG